MKKHFWGLLFLLTIIALITCTAIIFFKKNNSIQYYTLEQFDEIIVNVSTLNDVKNIADIEQFYVTSYGGVVEFPMRDSKWILIKFYGPEWVVGSIEIVAERWVQ